MIKSTIHLGITSPGNKQYINNNSKILFFFLKVKVHLCWAMKKKIILNNYLMKAVKINYKNQGHFQDLKDL